MICYNHEITDRKEKMLETILNKHNLIASIQEDLQRVLDDRYSQWSGMRNFADPLPKITYGAPGNYQIFYLDELVYFGTTNSNKEGKTSYGLYDRLRKKQTILVSHHNDPDKIRSLKEACIRKALDMGFDMHHSNWSYKFWKLPQDLPLVTEARVIRQLKEIGLCVLNSDRCVSR